MFQTPRSLDNDNKPNLAVSTLIYTSPEGTVSFCTNPSCSDLYDILETKLPAISEGKASLIIAWRGQWETDIFEVTKETIPLFQSIINDYGRGRFKTYKY